jgi:hypothetical protein
MLKYFSDTNLILRYFFNKIIRASMRETKEDLKIKNKIKLKCKQINKLTKQCRLLL